MQKTEPAWVDVVSKGELTGVEYVGKFQVKPFLNIGERRDAQALAEKYNMGITEWNTRLLYTQLAYMKFHVLKADATWWKNDGLDLHDEEPIMALANAIADVRESRNPDLKKKEEVKEDEQKPEA
jgi:hypothetical protein